MFDFDGKAPDPWCVSGPEAGLFSIRKRRGLSWRSDQGLAVVSWKILGSFPHLWFWICDGHELGRALCWVPFEAGSGAEEQHVRAGGAAVLPSSVAAGWWDGRRPPVVPSSCSAPSSLQCWARGAGPASLRRQKKSSAPWKAQPLGNSPARCPFCAYRAC